MIMSRPYCLTASSKLRGKLLNGYGPNASMSRKCRADSSSHPALRHKSGSIACSTMVVLYFSKNGRSSGGSKAIARSRMYLCASNPQASAGRGTRQTMTAKRAATTVRIAQLYRSDELSEDSQVFHVVRIGVTLATAVGRIELRRFEHHWQCGKSAVVEDSTERLQPKTTLADVLVTIDAAATGLLRVVEVKDRETVQAHDAIERGEGVVVTFR